MNKFLVIQTAFTGDVVLATAIVEKIHHHFPKAQIDFLLRKGNEGLLKEHPLISNLIIWNKSQNKNADLLRIAKQVRKERYTHVINPHRFGSSGFVSLFSRAAYRSGFNKNPFSFSYTRKITHTLSEPYIERPVHEVERNQLLIADITDDNFEMPKLYPSDSDRSFIAQFQSVPYICIAPSSVWFTKQFPVHKWVELINELPAGYPIYLLGAPSDQQLGETIISQTTVQNVTNLCGKLNFLQSAAIMQDAVMNYANDSAPLHFATAMNAPVTAVFCSTVPAFGFGPLRPNARVVEVSERLSCRPCGLHGHRTCPQGHFKCANEITNNQLLWWI